VTGTELIKDPLRGFSFDRYPYQKKEGEKSIDFSVKMFLYCVMFTVGVSLELPGIIVLFGLYFLSLVRK